MVAFCHYFLVMSQYSIPIKVLKNLSLLGVLKIKKKKSLAISMEICSQLPLNLPKINWVWLVLFGGVAWSDVFKRVGRFIAVQLEKCFDQPLYLRSGWVRTCTGYCHRFITRFKQFSVSKMRLTFAPFFVYYVTV